MTFCNQEVETSTNEPIVAPNPTNTDCGCVEIRSGTQSHTTGDERERHHLRGFRESLARKCPMITVTGIVNSLHVW